MEKLLAILSDWWVARFAYVASDTPRLARPSVDVRIVLQSGLLFGAGLISGSETALISLSRLDLQNLRR